MDFFPSAEKLQMLSVRLDGSESLKGLVHPKIFTIIYSLSSLALPMGVNGLNIHSE